jgi:predicted nucleic acid-binding protein
MMILLDTTFLVDVLRKDPDVTEWFNRTGEHPTYTAEINRFEIYLGLFSFLKGRNTKSAIAKRTEVEHLFARLYVLPFDEKAAIEAASLLSKLRRKGQEIDVRDAMIAGTSLANGIKSILTRNENHFKRIE